MPKNHEDNNRLNQSLIENPPPAATQDGVLARWSQRKLSVEKRERVEEETSAQQPVAAEVEESRRTLTDADMPSLETLNENSDYSGFMSPQVSGELRKFALRKLFSAARFNVRDGLDDYDDDFRSFTALGEIITSDMKHRMEVEARRREEQQAKAQVEQDMPTTQESMEQASAEETDEKQPVNPLASETPVEESLVIDDGLESNKPFSSKNNTPQDDVNT